MKKARRFHGSAVLDLEEAFDLMTLIRRVLRGACIGVLLASVASGQAVARPVLAVQGDRFALDGTTRFLVLVSYFGGLSRPAATLAGDLDWLKERGIDGIRVWPNLDVPIMNADGAVNPSRLDRLRAFIDAAATRGLIVDLSFHREGVCGNPVACDFTVSEFGQGIRAVAADLSERRNVLFDLQNEWDVHGHGIALSDLMSIRAAVRSVNRHIVVTASTTSGYGEDRAARDAFDVLAFHGARDAQGRWARETGDLIARLRGHQTFGRERPIYLQEPNRFRLPDERRPEMDQTPENYLTAASHAKQGGAAAWTFHTGAGFDLSSPTPFNQLLQPGELDVLNRLSTALAAVP